MQKNIRIATAQINTIVGNINHNSKKILEKVEEATQHKADIVCFPELSITGYPPEDLLLKPKFIHKNLLKLQELAVNIENIIAVIGFVDEKDGQIFNSAAVIYNKKIYGIYHKMLLPNYSVFDEKRYFTPGDQCPLFQFDGLNFGINICEDIWHTHGPLKEQTKKGADFVINLNASPFHLKKIEKREKVVCSSAKENNVFIVYTNLVGGQDELVFDGHSMVVSNKGEILARANSFKEDLLFTDISLAHKNNSASYSFLFKKKYENIIKIDKKSNKQTAIKPFKLTPDIPEVKSVYKALALGLKDYVHKNGFKKVILGLSGGIDSALVAAIATKALGKGNVIAVSMPSKYSSDATKSDAEKLAKNLGIEFHETSIEPLVKAYNSTLKEMFKDKEPDITEENLQARIRGNILMAMSNKFGYIVVSTGNKSETSVGYCTLYGDMVGGFAVIKDVPKTLVYKLCKYINQENDKDIIPKSTITRAPSAELRPNQKDSDSLPEYDTLDPILEDYILRDMCHKEISAKNYDEETVKKIIRLVDLNEYKRRQAPVGIKISPKAFGRDRRMPITNGYKV